ncbi:MAG: hypothetical protein IPK82_32685 [Polyangiaceae bacterium]|nr:hypothetical protein [Polyangiaceae bacterium]
MTKFAKVLVDGVVSERSSRAVRTLRTAGLFGLLGILPVIGSLGGCTPEKPPESPKVEPTASASANLSATAQAASQPDVYTPVGPFAEETLPALDTAPIAGLTLGAAPAGVEKAAASCSEYVKNKGAKVACGDRAAALAALDKALASVPDGKVDEAAVKSRDAALAALEECTPLPAGLVRALRADLAPVKCADVIVEPVLAAPPKDMRGDVHEALVGLALSARFARAGGPAPVLAAPFTRARVEAHIAGPLGKWMKEVATAVQGLSDAASKLHGYGGAVAAVGAGMADLTLVDTVRSAPIPEEFQKDEERKNIYYASLDEKLEPRKARGRDAALIGLKRFSEVGALHDERVREARRLLSKLYGGRRMDALDRLMIQPAKPSAAATVEDRLAERLPTFYAGILLDSVVLTQPSTLSILASRGLSVPHRKALRDAAPTAQLAPIAARAFLDLGRTYFRASDFESAAKMMALVPKSERTAELELLAALSIALRGGPKDAVEMMSKSLMGMSSMGQRQALEALSTKSGFEAGAAAFNAAYIMEITAPERADGVFFKGIARRYETAANLLPEGAAKTEAAERAKAAAAIAGEVK